MSMRSVGIVIIVSRCSAVSERAISEVAFDARTSGSVGVVEIPAPGATDEVECAGCFAGCEVGFDFEALDETDEIVGEFGCDGADVDPVCG